MKLLNSILLLTLFIGFTACEKDDDHNHGDEMGFEYHAHILEPNTDDKKVGDELQIKINYESHSGMTVHHINVTIHKKDDPSTVLYNKPSDAHIHNESGEFLYEDTFTLNADNGVEGHSDWVLVAKAWGPTAGEEEVIEEVGFHVHPE